jgi:hypothetical protein
MARRPSGVGGLVQNWVTPGDFSVAASARALQIERIDPKSGLPGLWKVHSTQPCRSCPAAILLRPQGKNKSVSTHFDWIYIDGNRQYKFV